MNAKDKMKNYLENLQTSSEEDTENLKKRYKDFSENYDDTNNSNEDSSDWSIKFLKVNYVIALILFVLISLDNFLILCGMKTGDSNIILLIGIPFLIFSFTRILYYMIKIEEYNKNK